MEQYVAVHARKITRNLLAALADSPAVLVHGARQVGKSTLVERLAADAHPARYLTLDDATTLAAASADPDGFVAGLGEQAVVLDEVQRVPELFRALKARIDRTRTPGRFLLTGSANVLAIPALADSLAGRMEIVTLWPLAEQELEAAEGTLIDRLFARRFEAPPRSRAPGVVDRILRGGYPEAVSRTSLARRRAWYGSYITTILQRDVRDLASIEGLGQLPRLLALLASRTAGLLNFSDLSRSLAIPQSTLKRYFALLEATHLVRPLPAWSTNLGLRLAKAPKLFLGDVGLAAHLVGADVRRLQDDGPLMGALLENLVAMELTKQASWSDAAPALFHFRTATGHEVDLVLEDASGRIVGVETKASRTVSGHDFKGLRALAAAAGKRFLRGVVLAMHDEPVSFGPDLWAIPMSSLWAG
jgi:predicted AAA+ superfamily ATPase